MSLQLSLGSPGTVGSHFWMLKKANQGEETLWTRRANSRRFCTVLYCTYKGTNGLARAERVIGTHAEVPMQRYLDHPFIIIITLCKASNSSNSSNSSKIAHDSP